MADKSYQKGITVEIGGNTAPLNKALADVGKQSRDLQTELKQVDKLLQVDPGNTELLAQKQKLLADSVKVTGDRLDVLRQAQEKFIAEGGKVDSAAYRDLQRDVIATEQKLGGLQKESEQTSGALDKAGDSAKEAGDKAAESGSDAEQGSGGWEKLGEGLAGATKAAVATTAAAGTALVAGVGYAVDFANEVQKASNSFIAATGISTDAVQDFDEAMLRIYNNNFGESMEDISTSMTTVAQSARDIDPKNIEMLTQNALMFRDTFGFEVGEQMRAVNMLIDQFGISGEEAFNLIAQGAQNGLDKNGDLLDSINEYSVHFKTLGMDAESMFNSFVNGAAGGTFSVDKLGDAIKEFGIRSKDGSEGSIKAFQAIGLNAEETTAAFAAGGEQASKAFEQVTASLFSLKDPLAQNTAGVALFGTMWEDLGVKGMEYLVDMNGEISTSVDALSAINAVKYDDFDSAMEGLGRVLKTNFVLPIGEEVLPALSDFVNELSAGAVTADGDISKMADSFGTATTGLVEDFSAIIPEITAIAGKIVGGLISGLATSLPEISTAAVELIGTLAQGLISALPDIAVAATDILLALVDGLIGALPLMLDGATQMILALANGIGEALPELIPQAVEAVLTLAENLLDNVDMLIDAALQLVTGLADGVIEALPILIDKAPDIIQKLVDAIIENLPKLVTAALELVIKLGAAIIENLPELYKAAYEIIESIGSGIIEYAGNLIKSAEEVITTIWDKIVNADWLKLGGDILAGIGNGISGAVKGVTDTVKNVSGKIVGGFMDYFDMNSPSKLMKELGGYIMEGMAIGISDNGDMPVDQMTEISQKAAQVATENAKSFKDFGKLYVDNLSKGMNEQKENAVKTVQALFDKQIASIKNKNLKAEYEKFGKEAISSYSKAIEAGAKEAEAIIKTQVQAITDEFQKQYDDLLKQQESMRAKLAGFGDMFTIDEESGEVQLANIRDNINALTRYDNALTALKGKGVSDNFLSEVTALSVNEATLFAEKLMSLSDKQFSAYTSNWERQQSKAKEIATKFYADELDALQKNFAQQIDTEMSKVPGLMNGIGQNSIQGWIDGVNGRMENAKSGVKNFANQMITTAKTTLGINSPSREFAEIGGYMAEGMGVGFTEKLDRVSTGMQSAIGGVGSLTAAEALNAINSGIMSNVGMLNQAVEAIVNQVLQSLQARQMNFQQQGIEMIKRMTAGVNSTVSQLTGRVSQMMQQVLTMIGGFQPKFVTTGENMVNGIWQGFQNKQSWLESQVRGMMQSIVAAVESEMDINSPSKVFAEIGGFMAEGLGLGFSEEMRREQERIDGAIPVDFENPRGGKTGELQSTANAGAAENLGIMNVTVNNYSPKSLTEAESAKQTKRALRDLALGVN